MNGLKPKEIVELRLKCLEPYVTVAAKHGIENNTVLQKAEEAWRYAIDPLKDLPIEIPAQRGRPRKE